MRKGRVREFLHDYLLAQDKLFSFLDIGANQGLYSMIARRNSNCAKIYAFEPVVPVADIMVENFLLNRTHGVVLIRSAVSDVTGSLQIPSQRRLITCAGRHLSGPDTDGQIQTIDHAELTRIVETERVPIIVKVDAEGHEPVVIAELLKCGFAPSIRAIFYECDQPWMSESAMREMLEIFGFDQFQKIGTGVHYDVLATRRAMQPASIGD